MKNKGLKFLDLFAGIGGVRLGMEQAGHSCVGWIEWDKFARKSYIAIHKPDGEFTEKDINNVTSQELPKADCWCFGFPCQDISVAGKQGGFTNGKRSSLFFKVTGLIKELEEEDKPSYLFIENVKNLLSINKGWDFAKLLIEMDEIGYDVEWDVFDSAEVVPQHRERIFIIGHLRGRSTRKVFPITRQGGETNKEIKEIAKINENRHSSEGNSVLDINGLGQTISATSFKHVMKVAINQIGNISNSKSYNGNPQVGRVYGTDGIAPTLSTMQGGGQEPKIAVREATKIGYSIAKLGDSINFAQPNSKTRRGRVGHGVANTLTTSIEQATLIQVASSVKKYANVVRPNAKPIVRITGKKDIRGSRQDSKKSGLSELQFTNPANKSSTVTASNPPKTWDKKLRIRKLTPRECWRLQGFPDWAFDKAKDAGLSNSQLYKQAGNSVTAPVIKAIADRMGYNYDRQETGEIVKLEAEK